MKNSLLILNRRALVRAEIEHRQLIRMSRALCTRYRSQPLHRPV